MCYNREGQQRPSLHPRTLDCAFPVGILSTLCCKRTLYLLGLQAPGTNLEVCGHRNTLPWGKGPTYFLQASPFQRSARMGAWSAHRTRDPELFRCLTAAGGHTLYSTGKGRGKVAHRPRDFLPKLPTDSPPPQSHRLLPSSSWVLALSSYLGTHPRGWKEEHTSTWMMALKATCS